MKLYSKAKEDLNWALKLNEDCLKSWLLFAKIYLLEGNHAEFEHSIKEAMERNPAKRVFITGIFFSHFFMELIYICYTV